MEIYLILNEVSYMIFLGIIIGIVLTIGGIIGYQFLRKRIK